MKLYVVGTGSSGNCYVLEHGNHRLILDAGMPMKDVIRTIGGLIGVEGCLVTHEHLDHCRTAIDMMNYGIQVFATDGTMEASKAWLGPFWQKVEFLQPFQTAHFMIVPFPTEHDAVEPCGFLIRHKPTGIQILYATDTYYLKNRFPGVNFWLIECNYSDEILHAQDEQGLIERQLLNRLRKSHMSLSRLKQTLKANDLTKTRKIVLLHLSNERSNEEQMVREVSEQTGIETVAADAGMVIDLELTPF